MLLPPCCWCCCSWGCAWAGPAAARQRFLTEIFVVVFVFAFPAGPNRGFDHRAKSPASQRTSNEIFSYMLLSMSQVEIRCCCYGFGKSQSKSTATHGGFNRVSLQFYYKLYIADPLCTGKNNVLIICENIVIWRTRSPCGVIYSIWKKHKPNNKKV